MSAQRRRHEALARETASWRSWTVQQWFTDGNMAVEVDPPFTGGAKLLEYECSCGDDAQTDHLFTLDRLCTFVDVYEAAPEMTGKLSRTLTRLSKRPLQAELVIDGPVIPAVATPGLLCYEARVKGNDAPHAWVALNARYVDAIRVHARPDRWLLCGMPTGVPIGTRFDVSEAPGVIALRGSRAVGVVMPIANNDSAIGIEIPRPTYVGEVAP